MTSRVAPMRKKLPIAVGLVAVVLAATALVCDRMGSKPPLRVGMTADEVCDALTASGGEPFVGIDLNYSDFENTGTKYIRSYSTMPDWLGNSQDIKVEFDEDYLAIRWTSHQEARSCPPWLNRALRAVGWK
jgi:hypothetical protein